MDGRCFRAGVCETCHWHPIERTRTTDRDELTLLFDVTSFVSLVKQFKESDKCRECSGCVHRKRLIVLIHIPVL
jgi:hypothetical protein